MAELIKPKIVISQHNKDRIDRFASYKGESYNDIMCVILDFCEKHQLNKTFKT